MIDKSRKYWHGDCADDIDEYLREYTEVPDIDIKPVICHSCGNDALELHIDCNEEAIQVKCPKCGEKRILLDCQEIWAEVKPKLRRCVVCKLSKKHNVRVGFVRRESGDATIWFDGICLSVTSEESKQINFDRRPKVILSASGMCEAGRIRHHLKHNLWGGENTVLFVGYQAEGSLGRKLQNGAQYVRLFGEDITVNAEIAALHGTSGHADQAGLLRWLAGFQERPQKVFVNHGDDGACIVFQKLLTQMGYNTEAPYSGAEYDLLTDSMTVYADSKPIRREQLVKGSARARAVYGELLAAAEALLAFVKTCKGRANKDNAKLASQIRNLIEKWK